MSYTKGTWNWDIDDLGIWIDVADIATPIAKMGKSSEHDAKANAEIICRAVNSFESLTERNKTLEKALKAAFGRLSSLQSYFTASNFTDRYNDAEYNAECLKQISAALNPESI